MRILNVTAQKPDSTGSGVYLSELLKGFLKMGHPQALIGGIYEEDVIHLPESVAMFPVYFQTKELPFPIAGMSDEMPYQSTRYRDMTEDMTEQFKNAFGEKIAEAIRIFQPDVILCHHLYFVTSLVCQLAGNIPVYGFCHGTDIRQIKKNPWQRDFIKEMIPRLNGIFALHQEQKREICQEFSCQEDMVRVIGTGYNNEVFYEPLNKVKKEPEDHEVTLVFAGKLSEKKGVISLLECSKLLPADGISYRLLLAGGYGNEKEYNRIKNLAEKVPVKVEFLGKLDQNRLANVMNQGDLFILPSFYEGLPLVVVEAMACGLKVICTDLPGIRPWLDEKVPNHQVAFVKPPEMENEDEPKKGSLPAFEQELAEIIAKEANHILNKREGTENESSPDLSKISWTGLCKVILEVIAAEKKEG